MQNIINGKLYDTETATLITEFSRKLTVTSQSPLFQTPRTYKRWVDCELYRTDKGAWFELEGTDLSTTNWNALSEDEAKPLLARVDSKKFMELYPSEIEEA